MGETFLFLIRLIGTEGENDERGYMVVVKLEDDGTTTGMIYRTPKRMS